MTGTNAGTKNNTTNAVTSTEGGTGGTASASITVVAPPTISKGFGAASIVIGHATTLSFTLANPAGNMVALTGVGFTDTLPAGLVVATPSGLTGSCGGGTITATAGSGSVSLTGATLLTNGSCTFSVNVTSNTANSYNNVTSNVTSNEGGNGGTAAASLSVFSTPPDFTLPAPSSVTVKAGGTAKVTITVTPFNGSFDNPITFACGDGVPPRAECLFPNGNSVTPHANPATLELDVATIANGTFLARHSNRLRGLYALWLAFPTLLVAGLCIAGRRSGKRKLGMWCVGGFLLLVLLVSGCGGVPGFPGTPPGIYNITVTGTAGTAQHSVTITVQVK